MTQYTAMYKGSDPKLWGRSALLEWDGQSPKVKAQFNQHELRDCLGKAVWINWHEFYAVDFKIFPKVEIGE